jgi:signal transduction histidine kinase
MSETVSALLLLVRDPQSAADDEVVDVVECIAPLIAAAREQANDGVTVRWHPQCNPVVHGPRVAVQTVAANLIRNAVQYTHKGNITVVLEDDRLSVVDTGIGIPREDLTKVGARGVRASNTMGEGSGLGLSVVIRLCERFGWTFRIESQLGRGTRAEWRFDLTES